MVDRSSNDRSLKNENRRESGHTVLTTQGVCLHVQNNPIALNREIGFWPRLGRIYVHLSNVISEKPQVCEHISLHSKHVTYAPTDALGKKCFALMV